MILTLLDDAMACNSDIGTSFMQTLYQYKSALPYMGCCTLPSSITKGPKDAEREYWLQNEKTLRSTIQQTTKAWLHSPVDDLGVGFEDEVRPANYVSNKINIY